MAQNNLDDSLTAAQADGLACVVCNADYLTVRTPHVTVPAQPTSQTSPTYSASSPRWQRVQADRRPLGRRRTTRAGVGTELLAGDHLLHTDFNPAQHPGHRYGAASRRLVLVDPGRGLDRHHLRRSLAHRRRQHAGRRRVVGIAAGSVGGSDAQSARRVHQDQRSPGGPDSRSRAAFLEATPP